MSSRAYKTTLLAGSILLIAASTLCFFSCKFSRAPVAACDQEAIESFFRRVFVRDGFGYTFFGNKPASCIGYFDPIPIDNWDRTQANNIIKEGWESWKHRLQKIKIRDYLFIEEISETDPSLKVITCVNKRAFVKTVDTYRELFERVLQREITGIQLLKELEDHREGLFDVVHHHEGLYGILLGYGKENAFLFQRRMNLNIYNPCPTFSLCEIHGKEASSLEEETHFLKNLDTVAEDTPLSPISLPVFIGIKESDESQRLIQHYRSVRKELTQVLYSDNFMDKIVHQLSSG